jgi:Protein of unknown function (DUF1364)
MTALRQRIEPIRSRRYLDGAKGENCKLRFPGCMNDRETVVACHIHDQASFGMASKADDFSVVDGCHHCHSIIDTRAHEFSRALMLEYVLRGLQETLRSRIDRGLLILSQDVKAPAGDRAVKPRKPVSDRAPIKSRPFAKSDTTLRSRNTFKPSAPNVRQIGDE